MKYLYFSIGLVVLLIIIYNILIPYLRIKKINKIFMLLDGNKFAITHYKNKNYDYTLENDEIIGYIKFIYIPSNSTVTINNKNTWKLTYGGSTSKIGRSYPYSRFLKEVTPFIDETIKKEKKIIKIIVLYPSTEHILKYLNECELETIDSSKTPYGYKVVGFDNFPNDLDMLFSIK